MSSGPRQRRKPSSRVKPPLRASPDGCRLVRDGNSAAVPPIAAAPEFGGIATAIFTRFSLGAAQPFYNKEYRKSKKWFNH